MTAVHRLSLVILAGAFLAIAAACSPGKPTNHALLLGESIRQIGQPAPKWLILQVGGYAYTPVFSDGIACLSENAFEQYNKSGDKLTPGCAKVEGWLQIRRVIPQDKNEYIVAVATSQNKSSLQYIGAGDLRPYIPQGTHLVVTQLQINSNGSEDANVAPELLDKPDFGTGKVIGKLLDHTLLQSDGNVYTAGVIPFLDVTVLTGELKAQTGYIAITDVTATTGDDIDSGYVGATADPHQ